MLQVSPRENLWQVTLITKVAMLLHAAAYYPVEAEIIPQS